MHFVNWLLKCSYLELDVLHITVKNTFHWLGGKKDEISAVHLEIMTIKVWFHVV